MNNHWRTGRPPGARDGDLEPEGTISLGSPRRILVSGMAFGRDMGGGICKQCGNPTTMLLPGGCCAGCGGSILPPLTVPQGRRG